MTPKEKAIELIDKFENETYSLIQGQLSKQCALIAVEEILKAVDNPDEKYSMKDSVDYWQEVKQEIENL